MMMNRVETGENKVKKKKKSREEGKSFSSKKVERSNTAFPESRSGCHFMKYLLIIKYLLSTKKRRIFQTMLFKIELEEMLQ
jgi:hypothetical protein